jgi:hypothetical protein
LLILGGLAAPPDAAAQMPEWSCVTCHSAFGDSPLGRPVQTYAEDVHAAEGFSCVACHGGDAEDPGLSAMDPAEGYVGAPERDEVVLLCGRCHSSAQFMRRYNPALRVDQVAAATNGSQPVSVVTQPTRSSRRPIRARLLTR